ncbi:DNA damage-binding protein [Hortaea werneckii]|nr:DNA damage-binding protein [Hortaea werneckii]
MLHFTTLDGAFGIHDLRTPAHETVELLQLSEKKIGGFSLHPAHPHIVATASLDRTMKIWDLRKISGKHDSRSPHLVGEHLSKLSVSHANFNSAGQVATASYDDTVKIYDFSSAATWSPGQTLSEEEMEPATIIPHNNQTGRWVTILRAQWQMQPQDGIQRFCIGNMNRFVDVYTSKGQQLAQLGGDGITAVPAVAKLHDSMDWIAAGTASGKLCLWQ